MSINLTPAEKVIFAFGGLRKAARQLNLSPGTISHWKNRKGKKFSEKGSIPQWNHKHILKTAKKLKLKLSEKDLYK